MDRGVWTAKTVKRPRQQPAHPQYANYWAPLTRKRHTMPHSAQSQHANYWAPRTRKRHQQEHRPQRPTESSDPTQHAKGRTGDCPGPRKGATTGRNVTQGVNDPPPPPLLDTPPPPNNAPPPHTHRPPCVQAAPSVGGAGKRRLNRPCTPPSAPVVKHKHIRLPHLCSGGGCKGLQGRGRGGPRPVVSSVPWSAKGPSWTCGGEMLHAPPAPTDFR